MSLETVTQAKRALIALFQEELGGKLALYDAAHEDSVVTPVPVKYWEAQKIDIANGFPCVEVFPTAGSPQSESEAQIYRHRFIVGFRFGGFDEEELERQSEAMMWALRHVARDTQLEVEIEGRDGDLGPVDTGNEEYVMLPTPGGTEVPFVKGGYIEMFVTTIEGS